MNLSRIRSIGLTALFGTLLSFSAFAEVKEGDIILFPDIASAGRAFRISYATKRVGLVLKKQLENGNDSIVVQEINYPSRQGIPIYRDGAPYDGTHTLSSDSPEIIERVDSAQWHSKQKLRQGSPIPIRKGIHTEPGYVLYVFKKEHGAIAAATDEEGWAYYQQYGDAVYTKESIFLKLIYCDESSC